MVSLHGPPDLTEADAINISVAVDTWMKVTASFVADPQRGQQIRELAEFVGYEGDVVLEILCELASVKRKIGESGANLVTVR